MLNYLSKILVVDDEKREIDKISAAFNELKIPAYCSLYSIAQPPLKPYKGIRLAFFDIKLLKGNYEEKQTINAFVNALKEYIDINNGPFILIFWTTNSDMIPKIKDYINTREKGVVPVPILIETIDKTLIGDFDKLIDSINSLISKDILKLLFDYESKVAHAAGQTLKTIFDVISDGQDSWGESNEFEKNFDTVFSNIAFEAYGFKHAKKNLVNAIRDGLNPVLINELNNITLSSEWSKKLKPLLDTTSKNKFVRLDSKYVCKFNSIYHLNTQISGKAKTDRGIVLELNHTNEMVSSVFGEKIDDIKQTFLPFDPDLIKKFDSELTSEKRKNIREGSKLILVEISASCDFAQDNYRNHTYILGLMAPAFDYRCCRHSEAIIKSPYFVYDSMDYILFFNSRFTISLIDSDSELLGEILFQIKNELLNKILTQYSNYISRLGIIQF